jgi:mono/diheme cytochrome c family protein
MNLVRAIGVVVLLSRGASAADVVTGEAKRGEQLFRTQQCIHCHSLNGQGGTYAPDLARRIDRNYNPSVMASVMWNHAPQMWAGMKRENLAQPQLSPEQAADLFAFFVSARYFEPRGDAGRGKQLFASKDCADCHGITDSKSSGAPPVVKWESLADPVVLVQQMWNHSATMTAALSRRKIGRLMLAPQDLTDILVYLQNLPQTRQMASSFSLPPSDSGAELFRSKGCTECHLPGRTPQPCSNWLTANVKRPCDMTDLEMRQSRRQ